MLSPARFLGLVACGLLFASSLSVLGCGSSDDEGGAGAGTGPEPTENGDGGTTFGAEGTNEGTPGGGDGSCHGAAENTQGAATISGYLDKLPYANPKEPLRGQVIDAILRTCDVFSPSADKNPGWKKEYCWAHLVSAIEKESSYDTEETIKDGYGGRSIGGSKANDPTVGLLQIRFSSTMHDYTLKGPADRLECIGCKFPAEFAAHKNDAGDSDFWAVSGPSKNLALMKSVSCNVGLGAWYYYFNATGNGNTGSPTYLTQYCQGKGTAANLVTGLLSHLKGPESARGIIVDMGGVDAMKNKDGGAFEYVTKIKGWFDTMVGPVAGTHPFFVKLSPDTSSYCTK